ncbi:hypothetical protein TMatcc_005336 [Talaromyces marneffei ATCC 18224]|uniref:Uncharacterized protein n=2 Tax=Talaromyces marneffei TaxID=37727 RepID=B6QB87_TALMQ|nr:uncharacterized protein EYB26_006109 [Talaromyces marneffei]EEA26396.1 conserved hypothetical protein [Talaromyces marneffei ATCC 18224]KAE8555088.1 hypothetical protein EYB25_003636 [Talaromyces marneffei]QGA18424.1 hypothetical protein EYB26_006109 [Talaromyces marneffei]
MRLFTFLVLLVGIAQTSAYSIPGGYERTLIYYLYSIDAQRNGGRPQKIAPACSRSATPCTLDQLLRYLADGALPNRPAPATSYPDLPPMDRTADAISAKDAAGKDFAGQVNPGRTLPGASSDWSKCLAQLGDIAMGFAESSPEHASLLKANLQAVRNARRNAQLTTFMAANRDINVKFDTIPLYDGADNSRTVEVINPRETVTQNSGLTAKALGERWMGNTEGGHTSNVEALASVLKNWDLVCG